MFNSGKKDDWKGYRGPLDHLKEEIILECEKRGLKQTMARFPKTGNISLSFYNSKHELFCYDINTLHKIRGKISEGAFSISLCIDKFTEHPGPEPHFHFHSIPKVEIPNRNLYLFRGYPQLDLCVAEDVIDSYRIPTHPHTIRYEPSPETIYRSSLRPYEFDSEMKLILKEDDSSRRRDTDPMRKREYAPLNLKKFPKEMKAGEAIEPFGEFLQKVIAYLRSLPTEEANVA